jgi:oxygen-dependent protoporphyrinogen oxidase
VERVGDAPLRPDEDISVGALIRDRFGDDVLEHLVDPLLGGINAGDSDRLSLRAAAPQIAAAAECSASLVEGLRAAPTVGGPVFWALPTGMASLVDALVAALAGVTFVDDAVDDLGAVLADTGRDGVVLATPAAAASSLLGRVGASEAASLLHDVAHASPVLLALAFRRSDVRDPLAGSGFLVPKVEGRMVTACSFTSTKWAHLADDPDGTVILRASAGRFGDDRAIGIDDDVLLAAVLRDLDDLLGLGGDPVEVRITRWRHGFPQYEPGHLDRVERIERCVAAVPGPSVVLAGAAYRGIGIPACIRQGRAAARSLVGARPRR